MYKRQVENRGIRTAILNVSFTCHMPDCLEMPYQPAVRGAEMGDAGPYVYRLGGNSCLSGDYIDVYKRQRWHCRTLPPLPYPGGAGEEPAS